MLTCLRKRGVTLLAVILAIAGLGAVPALASEESGGRSAALETPVSDAMLTKVIDAAAGYEISGDSYSFSFTQKYQTENGLANLAADSDESAPIATYKITVPANTVLQLGDSGNSRGDNSLAQTAIHVRLSDVIAGTTFPHAGVFIYEVRESQTSSTHGANINPSAAVYIMRIYVENKATSGEGGTSTTTPAADIVTIQKTHDEDGNPLENATKVDSTYPRLSSTGMITNESGTELTDGSVPAGQGRGRNVYGFTFANEYVGGGPVSITKRITGKYADKTHKFPVSVTIRDNAAPAGSCLSYNVEGGTDVTNNGNPVKLSGVESNKTDYMVVFDDSKEVTISAELADGDVINITGLYGWETETETYTNDPAFGRVDHRMKFTDGLKQGTSCTVVESDLGDYAASASVVYKVTKTSDETIDEITNADSASFTFTPTIGAEGSAITITNNLDEQYPNRTGILIDNLPYVIMVGVPLAVFALMFVSKRRSRTDA